MPTATDEAVQVSCFRQVAQGLSVEKLLNAVHAKPQLWQAITERQTTPGSPHKDTEAIYLRWPQDLSIKACFNDVSVVDLTYLDELPEAHDLINGLVERCGSVRLARVMIVKLKPGGMIDWHHDDGVYADSFDRFHVVLQSELGNEFRCGSQVALMQPGEAWWFNQKLPHSVVNFSNVDRIHLIVDMVAPDFRRLRGQTVTYQREEAHDLWPEIMPLLEKHYREIAHYQDIPLSVDQNTYNLLEDQGKLYVFTARKSDWQLIGYAIYLVSFNLHYDASLQARQDVLFVDPDHRRSRVGLELIRYADKGLAAVGVQVVMQHVKTAHNFGPLLERLGYEHVEHLYTKRLDQ